mgnify:FL=1
MRIEQVGSDIELRGVENYRIAQIFDCGQTFRFDPAVHEDGSVTVGGIALGRVLELEQRGDNVTIRNMSVDELDVSFRRYLALDDDYDAIRRELVEGHGYDRIMEAAMSCGSGIRILHQEPWEALCSFIVSQNNNIPRIKGIISRMCERFGGSIDGVNYAFPTAQSLAQAGVDAVFACGTGFRAKYIIDAAERVADGDIDLDVIAELPTAEAAEQLMRIKGVGPKVAACALLFGFGKTDAFPIDVWVKRVLAKYYPPDFDPSVFGRYAGLAQQYLFYYERYGGSRDAGNERDERNERDAAF